MPLMEIEHITKVYESDGVETHALRGVSFAIDKGEFVAIMGPSGSGKSTLLHVLGFLDRHTDGVYRFERKTMDEYSSDEIALMRNEKMGFIFQAFNLLARVSVYENVTLPLLYSRISKKEWHHRVEHAIESVGLAHRSQFHTSKLSGGEKQRVAIARALVLDPEVIFADEPTGNLDSVSGEAVMTILDEVNKKQGTTIILITHETVTAAFAHRIITMKDGQVEHDKKVGENGERRGYQK